MSCVDFATAFSRLLDMGRNVSLRWVLVLIGLLGICLFGLTSAARRSEPGNEPLLIHAEQLHFSGVWAQAQYRHKVKVQNTSETPKTIDFSVTCTCMGVTPTELTIPPHADATVEMTFDLRQRIELFEAKLIATIGLLI